MDLHPQCNKGLERCGFICEHQPESRSQSSCPASTSHSKASSPEMHNASRGHVTSSPFVPQQPRARLTRTWQGGNIAGMQRSPAKYQHCVTPGCTHKLKLHATAKQTLTYFHKASRALLLVFRSQRKQVNVKPAPGSPHPQPQPDTQVPWSRFQHLFAQAGRALQLLRACSALQTSRCGG